MLFRLMVLTKIALACICFNPCWAQNMLSPPGIGSRLPPVALEMLNKSKNTVHPNSLFNGKWTILDIWSIHCASCVAGVLNLDSLRREFSDKVQVIFITEQSEEQVRNLFSRVGTKKLPEPMIFNDTMFYEALFPHNGDPLHVWIDSSGVIRYITPGYNTTAENIHKAVSGKELIVSTQSRMRDIDGSSPLLELAGSKLKDYTEQYSLLMKGVYERVNGVNIEVVRDSASGNPVKIRALNASILSLFQLAYNPVLYGYDVNLFSLAKNNRVILKTAAAKRLQMPPNASDLDVWNRQNLYCYELRLPVEKHNRLFTIFRDDLGRYFPFKASVQNRRLRCLVLTNIHRPDKRVTFSGDNRAASSFLRDLTYASQNLKFPLVNEARIEAQARLRMQGYAKSLKDLNNALERLHLKLIESNRMVKVLIIE